MFSEVFDVIISGPLLQRVRSKLSKPRVIDGYCEKGVSECVQGGCFSNNVGVLKRCYMLDISNNDDFEF